MNVLLLSFSSDEILSDFGQIDLPRGETFPNAGCR